MKNSKKKFNKKPKNFKTLIPAIICLILAIAAFVLAFVYFGKNGDSDTSSELSDEISDVASEASVSEPDIVSKPEEADIYEISVKKILGNVSNLKTSFAEKTDENYISAIKEKLGEDTVHALADALAEGVVDNKILREKVGHTERAFMAIVEDDLERTTVLENTEDGVTELVFVGDISFDDNYSVMLSYKSRGKGVEGIVDQGVLDIMRKATITMGNNEFTLTKRGSPVPGKKFTFRGDPKNVSIYGEMGIDIVGLANNHASDFGEISLLDTIDTLDQYGMPHVGAGKNIDDAKEPYYFIVNGEVYGYVAGSVIDRYSTLTAGKNNPGVYKMYDTNEMCELIRSTAEKADHVIVYAHWGVESTTNLTDGQKYMGKAFVDAGADVVVGMHSHCMQGIEYYKDKLIVYSLGNFTFSSISLTCGMLSTSFSPDGTITNKFYPMMQTGNFTYINGGQKGSSQAELLKSISYNTEFCDDFIVRPKK